MGEAISYGWLRPEVQVFAGTEGYHIRYAHWEVRLPKGALGDQDLLEFLTPGRSVACGHDNPEIAGLLALLDAQGCFQRTDPPEPCSMQELRRRFDRLRSAWYAEYYAHPLWNRLRKGQASRNELLAWVIHNYHISRVAGAAAARCASRPYPFDFRHRFLQDTLDEYWHVNAFYFVRHAGLTVHDEDVKSYVPLAGSRAFELLTMQVADRNPLGHLLIAYFQESTAVFLDDCVTFYRDVEGAYNLPGFFDSWVAHMRIDIKEGHARGLSDLFDNERSVAPEDQIDAIRCAYLAYSYLYASLDQVLEQARLDDTLDFRHPREFLEQSRRVALSLQSEHQEHLTSDLLSGALQATLGCLGRTLDHDAVMALGRLCQMLQSSRADGWLKNRTSIWSEAISLLLQERAVDPIHLATLLQSLELKCQDRRVSFLPRDAFNALAQILTQSQPESIASVHLKVDARRIGEFLDLALQSPLIASGAYTP